MKLKIDVWHAALKAVVKQVLTESTVSSKALTMQQMK
jgi:hypothetical protein